MKMLSRAERGFLLGVLIGSFACLHVVTEFLDVGLTKMKKKKVLYNKCISVGVLFESCSYERSLVICFFFLPF